MLITRCPNCETTFRVRMEQLNLRGGRVRCGHCHNPFSALASLEELPDEVLLPAAAGGSQAEASPQITPAPHQAPERSAEVAPAPLAQPVTASTDEHATHAAPITQTPEFAATVIGTAVPEAEEEDFGLEFDLGDKAESPAQTEMPAPITVPEPEPIEPEQFIELGSAEDDATLEAEEFSTKRNDDDSIKTRDVDHQISDDDAGEDDLDDSDNGDEETVPQLHTVFLDDDIPPGAHIDPAVAAARAKTRRTLILGNVLLLLSGLVLSAYVLRVEITRYYPGLRAPLEQACSYLSCQVPYPRDADAVELIGSDLTQATGTKGAYHLAVTLRSKARYPVAWPQMEITLTDRFERALTRRVLEPNEWLPAEMAKRPAFEAQGELTSQITLSSDSQVMGYRLGVFYR